MSTTVVRPRQPRGTAFARSETLPIRHPTAAFFVLAYAFSWLLWAAPALGLRGVPGALLLYLGVFGPAAAAAVLVKLLGGSIRAWTSSFRRRPGARWYAAVLLLPVPLVAAASLLFTLTGRELDSALLGERLVAYVPILIVWTLAAVGEEPGWRGFALPHLQELLSPVRATLVLGVLWAGWHLPLLAAADEPSHGLEAMPLVAVSLATVGAIVGYSFFYTWFFNRTGSTWLAIVLHGSFTAANGTFVLVAIDNQVGSTYAALQFAMTAVVLTAAVVLVRVTHGRLGLPPSAVVGQRRHELPAWSSAPATRPTAALGIPFLAGLGLAAAMPRGPVTTAGAYGALALGVAAGAAAGFALRSRWAALVAPLALVAVFEAGRLGADGPTVEAPSFDTSYGVLAFLLGRGFFALVVLVPAAVAAAYGAALARRLGGGKSHGGWAVSRRIALLVPAAGVVVLALLLARPASVPPVLGPDGEPVAGSIASLERVSIGGVDQWISVRGHDADNPVLLYLSGGPGQTDFPQTRVLLRDLEDDVTVVNWDERGVGKSYAQLDTELTLGRAVGDAIQLAAYLRVRFDERRIYLLGESWGSLLGVLAVERRPDLFHAYIGSGQMVDLAETDRRLYRDMLSYARRTGDEAAAARMRGYGPPPYEDVFANAYVMSYYDRLAPEYDVLPYVEERYDRDPYGPWGVLGSEYTLVDRVNVLRGLIDYFATLYPQAQSVDLRQDVRRLEVPVYVLGGAHELPARAALVPEWFQTLQAPEKRLIRFPASGHAPAFEEFRRLERLLTETVLPATYDAGG